MPTTEQIKSAAESGIKVVINLALSTSEKALQNESALVEASGMKYIHIPVQWDNPTRQNLDDFLQAMDAHQGDKTLVHCQANYRATGFITLYRIQRLGWQKEEAFRDLRRIWNPEEYPIWQKFLDENITK